VAEVVSVWIATEDEAPDVGRLMIAFRNWVGTDWPSDEAFRRRAAELVARDDTDFLLGAPMLEAAIERARERGCRRIMLDTGSDNAPAVRLYERFGFSTGRADHHGIFMRRRIAENMPPGAPPPT
jgi:GNAT superfamily N-acetyltransferase